MRQKSKKLSRLPVYFTPADIAALLDHVKTPKAELLVRLQWRAGLRVSEAVNLTPSNVDLAEGNFRLIGKGNKERLVPIHPELVQPLRLLSYGVKAGEAIIGCDRRTAWRWVKEAWAAAVQSGAVQEKPGRVGTHTMRHGAARHWLDNDVPINRVSLWLGHSDVKTTMIYLALLPDPGDSMADIP